jgi:hypothetical protein
MKTALTVLATIALAIGTGFVVAQTAPSPANAPPDAAPPVANPPPGTTPRPRNAMAPRSGASATRSMMVPPDFGTLDRNGVGYVTQGEAASNPWLSRNFATCDADRNGRVTRAEYMTCAKR